MDKWKILGVDRTTEKERIKEAYRSRLLHVNPEDDPEGFMMLRKAYEEALSESDAGEEEGIECGLLHEITILYEDFQRRIDVNEWKKLLDRDEFISLDTADDSMNVLLSFLLEHSCIPQRVFQLIGEAFHIKENRKKLAENYPERFLELILDNAKYKDRINYGLFERVDGDIDEFITMYYKLDGAVLSGDVEEEARYLNAIGKFGIYHPYVEICRLRHEFHEISARSDDPLERREKYAAELRGLQERAEALLQKHKGEVFFLLACGDFAIARGKYPEAEAYYGMAGTADPEDYVVKARWGNFYCETGEYEKARDIFQELSDVDRYDIEARIGLSRANDGMIEGLKKELRKEPDDEKRKLQLARCYQQNFLLEEAMEVLNSMEPAEDNRCEYYFLLGKNDLLTEKYEQARKYFLAWIKEMEANFGPDQSGEKREENDRYKSVNCYIAECCIGMERYDEARKYLKAAMSGEKDFELYAYELMCRLEYECENYGACISTCQKALEKDKSYRAHLYIAKSYERLGEDSLALDACERAIEICPYAQEPYVLELEIYWNLDQLDDMRSVIDRCRRIGIDDGQIDYYRAELFEAEKNYGQALQCFERALEAEPDSWYLLDRIAGLCHVTGAFDRECDCYDRMLAAAADEEDRKNAYIGKAAALSCMKSFEEAKKIYKICETEFGLAGGYVIDYAELLVRMNDLPGCVRLMERCISESDDRFFVQCCLGNLCCFYGNEGYIDDAHRVFERAVENDREDYQIYRSMGLIYLEHGMYEKAKETLLKAWELDAQKAGFISGPCLLAIGKTDDITGPEYRKYMDVGMYQCEDAGDSYTYVRSAEFCRSIGEYEDAMAFADLAIREEREPGSCFSARHDAWCEKGNIYREKKEYKSAVECYQTALQIFGHHALYEEYIRQCMEAQNL